MNFLQSVAKQGITPYLARTKEAAEHFKVSEMTLWRWRQDLTFPKPLKRRRMVLYDIAAIEQWLREEGGH